MKNALTLSSLVLVAAITIAELVRSAGLQAPHVLGIGQAALAFSALVLTQLMLADYGAKARPIALPGSRRFPHARRLGSTASAYHHVYAVRRGIEAARLASPNRVVVSPRRTPLHSRTAA